MAEVSGRRYVVRGRVQGVGFRAFVLQRARRLGLRGSVRNLADGSVEVRAWGDEVGLAELRAHLADGPGHARARVEAVDAAPLAGEPPPAFEILHLLG